MRGKNIMWIAMVAVLLSPAFMVRASTAQTLPRVYLEPATLTLPASYSYTFNVMIEDAVDVYAWEVKLKHNIYAMTFLSPPIEGSFLSESGAYSTFFAWTYNSQAGRLQMGSTRTGDTTPGANGDGLLGQVRLRAEVGGLDKSWTVDLYDVVLLDSDLNPIASQEPGDATVNIGWPPWLWETELYLNTSKGGKIWTEWQTANLVPDFYGYPDEYMWPDQWVYCRIRNHGSAGGLYVRVVFTVMEAGWPNRVYQSKPEFITANSQVISSGKLGLVDTAYGLYRPPWSQQQVPGTVTLKGRLQISLEGYFFFYHDLIMPKLPGNGLWENPDGATGKFKLLPP